MTQKITEKAFVIGFGRFGRLLFDIIKSDTNIINLTNEHIDNYSRIDISVNKREMGKLFKSKCNLICLTLKLFL